MILTLAVDIVRPEDDVIQATRTIKQEGGHACLLELPLLRMLAFTPAQAVAQAPVLAARAISAPVSTPSRPVSLPVSPVSVSQTVTHVVPVRAPAPEIQVKAPVRTPGSQACPEWPELLRALNVQAMAQQLAKHCVLDKVEDQQVVLRLAQEHKHLQTKMATDNLQTALSDYFGYPVKLSVVLGRVEVATPAKIERDTREVNQLQANESIAQDEFVNKAQIQLAATVLAESIISNKSIN